MKRISIIKNNIITNQATLPEQEALDWLSHHESMKTFGNPSYVIQQLISEEVPAEFDENGDEISPAIPALYESVKVDGDYEVEITDVTSEIEQAEINAKALEFLASSDYKVLRHLRQKALGLETTLSEAEYLALEEARNEAALKIKR